VGAVQVTDPVSRSDLIAAYDVLDGSTDESLQGLVDLAALVCDAPMAAINLITEDQQHQPAAAGVEPWVCGLEDSMCARVLDDPETVVSRDARVDPRFADHPYVDGTRGTIRFYSSAPLATPQRRVIGRLCVFDDVEPHELSPQRQRVLAEIADRVVDVLELRLRSRQLELSLAELTRTRDELNRSNQLLTLFAGQVSHDLRSPLTAIIANAEILTQEPLVRQDPEVARFADATLAAGHRMAALIETMLSMTRVGAQLAPVEIDLDEVVRDVLTDLDPVLEERRARVTREGLPRVRADRQQVYAVLLNLVSNAVKFCPPTTRPQVVVRADLVEGQWRVAVTDNGRGVGTEDKEGLFELYRRGDGSVEGSGIGLASARRSVEAHGGRIGIEDAPGGGTTVWFTLPA
jgi:signal transduction histidine kinase